MAAIDPDDALTYSQVQSIKASLWQRGSVDRRALETASPRVIGLGDSWFDYAPGLDILDQLYRMQKYAILKEAHAGHTIEHMVYGTESDNGSEPLPAPLARVTALAAKYKPHALLLSAGGNDLAGMRLDSFFNHAASGLPAVRDAFVRFEFETYVRGALDRIVSSLRSVSTGTRIILHGYGNPTPDGSAVGFVVRFAGPWLRPTMLRKQFFDLDYGRQLMAELISRLNDVLMNFARANSNVIFLDLRGMINEGDWVNELHLRNSAYRRVAQAFAVAIDAPDATMVAA